MSQRTLLLFAHMGIELAIIGRALREQGYLVFPSRFHEEGVDALIRVEPDVVLIDATHYTTIATPEFRELAARIGATVLIYMRATGYDDAAALQPLLPFAYPVLDFTGDGRALAALVLEVQQEGAGPPGDTPQLP